jgi:mRNA interferase MazF
MPLAEVTQAWAADAVARPAPPRPARARHARVTASPQRGQVYRCDLGYGLKPWLVVSNNARNRLLDDIIAIRLTATARDLPTWVKLSPADPLAGYANADCIGQLGKDAVLGASGPVAGLERVSASIRIVA